MIIINDNNHSNPFDESNDNKKITTKEWVTKIITILTSIVIKTMIIWIIKILIIILIMITIVMINNNN